MSDTLNLSDPRGLQGDRRSPLMPFGNGKKRVAYIVLGGVVSVGGTVLTAQWAAEDVAAREAVKAQAALEKAVAVIEERQNNQNEAVLRELQQLREDLREMGRVRR